MQADFYKIAESLVGCSVDQLIPCRSGRNSRVFKVVCGNDRFTLKSYPPKTNDTRDRFATEIKALKFYEANCIRYTPRLLAVDISRNMALLEWLDGCPVAMPATNDLKLAIDFIAQTHAAETGGGDDFGLAAEPCLSGSALYQQLLLRLESLLSIVPLELQLKVFLEHEVLPILELARNHALCASFSMQLPQKKQSLIPADFGFHNAIKTVSGRLYFFDFEYFGWDDPVRLTADFLLHPGMALDQDKQLRFRQGMIALFETNKEFEQRLARLLPLYGIRWALILLNEFLPERWQARVFAGETATWGEIKALQLEKSRIALNKALACLAAP